MKDVPGGKKASLEELLQNTIPKILEKRKYKIQRDRTIKIRCTLGMDGSGFVIFDFTVYQLFVYNSIIGLTRFTMAKRVLVNRRTKYLVCMAFLQFCSCLFTLRIPWMYVGGVRVITIREKSNKLVFREKSRSAETVSPYFLINGKLVTYICMTIEFTKFLSKCVRV